MIRQPGWESRLSEAVVRHEQMPFEWGKSDCFRLMMDTIKALTSYDPYPELDGAYSTEAEALQRLEDRGFVSVEEFIQPLYPPIEPSFARRGDIAIIPAELGLPGEWKVAGAIVTGKNVVGKSSSSDPRLRNGTLYLRKSNKFSYYAVG